MKKSAKLSTASTFKRYLNLEVFDTFPHVEVATGTVFDSLVTLGAVREITSGRIVCRKMDRLTGAVSPTCNNSVNKPLRCSARPPWPPQRGPLFRLHRTIARRWIACWKPS